MQSGMPTPRLITRNDDLEAVAARCSTAVSLAVDGEGDGLHAYRSKLCVLQLAWREGAELVVAIVDALALDLSPLSEVLGPNGPAKVLHDLTFDARMLLERDVELGNVRDTSVSARFLGLEATGLASLCEVRLGVKLEKRLQEHNWAQRPFTTPQLEYLAGDVTHLLALDARLLAEAEAAGITEEIAEECRYKLMTALRPPKPGKPPWARVKGYRQLPDVDKAVLQRLVAQRERIAERLDRPPFKVASNKILFDLAQKKPRRSADIRRFLQRGPGRFSSEWLAAIARGMADEAPEPLRHTPTPPMSARDVSLRKHLDDALNQWRRVEARRRQVDLQVVLPGHCMSDAVAVLADHGADRSALEAALAGVEGLGQKRIDSYADAWHALALAAQASVS